MKDIRGLLSSIVDSANDSWWKPDLFQKNILPIFPEEITIVSLPPTTDSENCNCVTYALDLLAEAQLDELSHKSIDPRFITYLIRTNALIEITDGKVLPGTLIVYAPSIDSIQHVGLMDDKDTVISKWNVGPVLKHKILHIPQTYGDTVKFYTLPSHDRIVEIYKKLHPKL